MSALILTSCDTAPAESMETNNPPKLRTQALKVHIFDIQGMLQTGNLFLLLLLPHRKWLMLQVYTDKHSCVSKTVKISFVKINGTRAAT